MDSLPASSITVLQSLLDLKVAEIITEPTPWLCHCVLMKGEMTSARDCLLVFWQIALCGQQRGQVARVSFGEAHWTAGGWSTGCGGDWECFSRGATWSQPFPGVGAERHLYKYHLFQVFISVLLPHYLYFDVCKSDETPPPERLRPRFCVDIFFASSLAKVSENPRAESWHTDDSYQCVHKRVKCFKFAA